uniref:Uncharacterized protein n=1 Tax=Pan troglodytes TaxID=9598 RepID=A0A2I3SQ58_PANTR
MLARRGITLQKMEMPKQTSHRKLKVLEMPSEVCAFLIAFEIQFFFFFFFFLRWSLALSYVVSTQNTSLFWGEGAYVTNRMSPKLDGCGENTFPF